MLYTDFLASKALSVAPVGFSPTDYTADLFPFQRDIVALACKLGRFCVWADCGMGKTPMQLEWASQVCRHTGGRVLVLAPLAVSHQTVRESVKFGINGVAFAATPADMQFRHARDNDDERHICPLQLDVIRRGIQLWTNPGDLVLSPFMGIGSEGFVSLELGRTFVGFELKPSYYDVAVKNLAAALKQRDQMTMFAESEA